IARFFAACRHCSSPTGRDWITEFLPTGVSAMARASLKADGEIFVSAKSSIATKDDLVLLVQSGAQARHFLLDNPLQVGGIVGQLLELRDKRIGIQLLKVVAIMRQPHLTHQRGALMVKRNGNDRLVKEQGKKHVVEAGRHDGVRGGKLRE